MFSLGTAEKWQAAAHLQWFALGNSETPHKLQHSDWSMQHTEATAENQTAQNIRKPGGPKSHREEGK